jgi:hypothetical protein
MPELSYRQELDLLEYMEDALQGNHGEINLQDIAHQISAEWPSDQYGERVTQWLQAGQPDIDDTSAEEWTDYITDLLDDRDKGSLTLTLHKVAGVILQTLAFDYLGNVVDLWKDTNAEALQKVTLEIRKHRSDLMQHDGLALTPPYEFPLGIHNGTRYTVQATPEN